ncbi:hypothetical protein GGI15_002739 [Coemansia interrupta]|uniref:Uncharacterized protein n=1 Tax=Coemansia interrupta TaxID=1126814 RepID=A0A9W8LKS6_9FUNG|nr:hypothetical protein GGI15_002739 [Coemansia interrupta]
MVEYINTCIANLLNAYIREANSLDADDYSCLVFNNGVPRGYYAKFLKKLIEEIYSEQANIAAQSQSVTVKPVIPIHIEAQTSSSKVANALASLFDGEESVKIDGKSSVSPIGIGSSSTMPSFGTAMSEFSTDASELSRSIGLRSIQPSLPTMSKLKRTQSTPSWPSDKLSIA